MSNRAALFLVGFTFSVGISLFLIDERWQLTPNQMGRIFQPDNSRLVMLGEGIYLDNCASCHGENLQGQTSDWMSPTADGKLLAPPHDETGHTWHHSDQLLFDLIKFGIAEATGLKGYDTNMPIYNNELTDHEIIAVMSFIKSKWPKQIQDRHDQLNANSN